MNKNRFSQNYSSLSTVNIFLFSVDKHVYNLNKKGVYPVNLKGIKQPLTAKPSYTRASQIMIKKYQFNAPNN